MHVAGRWSYGSRSYDPGAQACAVAIVFCGVVGNDQADQR
jgi:hypothetical protein